MPDKTKEQICEIANKKNGKNWKPENIIFSGTGAEFAKGEWRKKATSQNVAYTTCIDGVYYVFQDNVKSGVIND